MSKIKFFYFDMGNVLLLLNRPRAAQKAAELIDLPVEKIHELLTDNQVELDYEAGKISSQEFYEAFCAATDSKPGYDQFAGAICSLFDMNTSMFLVVGRLLSTSHRVGLLSNTNDIHWQYLKNRRYSLFPDSFHTAILSFEVGANKPDEKIYQAAIEKSGFAADEILFVDDKPENVEAAKQAGMDAVVYTTTADYIKELRQREVQFNL